MPCMTRKIGAERRGGETSLVVEIDLGIVGPPVTNGSRCDDFRAGYENVFAVDGGFRPKKMPILSGNGKPSQRSALADQSAADMIK